MQFCAERLTKMNDIAEIKWNLNVKTGTQIRKLNGGNLAPNIANEMAGSNIRKSFKELNLAFTRLHDAPLVNAGCRLVDISHIFPLFHLDENDSRNYDFSYTDDYITNCIKDAGTPVFYRLGESIDHSINKYKINPPSDVDKWINICSNIIRHYTEGLWNGFKYDIKYWEIWNEPECSGNKKLDPNAKNLMWLGTIDEFNEFYVKTATELKKRFPHLMIGGPAHCNFDSESGINLNFIKYCAAHKAPLDFYSYHCYSADPCGWIQQTPAKIRKFLDDNGYPDTEIHLNEWHYMPADWHRLRNDTGYKTHMYEEEMKGLDSAAYLTTVMALWQDTPLSYGAYYTCNNSNWGCYINGSTRPAPSWYGLKAFGEIVRYPVRLQAESSVKNVTVIAGEDENGEKAMLISAFQTGNYDYRITLDTKVVPEQCEIRLLDNYHNLSLAEEAVVEGNTITLSSDSHSACILIKIHKKLSPTPL